MTDQYLERRLETVETTLTGLREDVADMRQDMFTLRDDQLSIRQDVSALRDDQVSIRQDVSALRDDQVSMRQDIAALRDDHGSLSQYVVAMEQRLTAAIDQTNVHMRVLHEDLVQRLATSPCSAGTSTSPGPALSDPRTDAAHPTAPG